MKPTLYAIAMVVLTLAAMWSHAANELTKQDNDRVHLRAEMREQLKTGMAENEVREIVRNQSPLNSLRFRRARP